ncbi:MAG: hypothetical protein JO112_17700, partial [Planctomycetes bacterium]|nr:hypothetical protein [Planctomycetota bacterium]
PEKITSRPSTLEELLATVARRQVPPQPSATRHWDIPLPVVLTADPMEGQVTLHLAGAELVQVQSVGLQETATGSLANSHAPWRTFRYGSLPVALTLQGQTVPGHSAEEVIDRAQGTTFVEREGRLLHHYAFRVWNCRQPALNLHLPAGARLLGAKVDGRWAPRPDSSSEEGLVQLPVPASPAYHDFQIIYVTQSPAWNVWTQLEAPLPELPVPPLALRRIWCLPPGISPLRPSRFHRVAGSAEEGQTASGKRDRLFPFLPSPSLLWPPRGPDQDAGAVGLVPNQGESASAAAKDAVDPLLEENPGPEWTVWEPEAGLGPDEPLLVVCEGILPVVGLVLAGVLVLTAWRGRRWPSRVRVGLLLAWLLSAGLALLWLPAPLQSLAWWPALAGLCVGVVEYLRSVAGAPAPRAALPGAVALLVLGSVVQLPAQVTALAPVTVFLVPARTDTAEPEAVLAPPELLEELQTLARRGVSGWRNAALLSARYEGTTTEAGAVFKAEFQVYNFAEEAVPLTLPLGGVQLQEALLDGAMVDLTALAPPREGYSLQVKGRGSHTLTLRFAVSVTALGEDRDLKLTIPELVQSRLTLDVPAGVRFLYSLAGRGWQKVNPTPAGPEKPAGLRLETDLGRTGVVHLHWRQEVAPPQEPVVRVREGYLWDLHPQASSLFALLQYTVSQGAATALTVALPEHLEVRGVEVGRLPDAGPDDEVPRLKGWRLLDAGASRRVELEFQRPLTTGAQVILELVPRQPLGPSVVLPLPVPEGVQPPEEKGQEPLFAYRVEGLTAQITESLRVKRINTKVFQEFWELAGRDDPGPGTQAFVFQRTPAGLPLVRLRLAPVPSRTDCVQHLSWRVYPGQADVTATARLNDPDQDLVLVQWQVPAPITVADVTGPDLRSWSQSGTVVQAWLQHPLGETTLQWTGWQLLAAPGQTATAFSLSPLPMRSAGSHTSYVHVTPGSGLALRAEGLKNLGPLPNAQASEREHSFVTDHEDYGGTFHLYPARTGAEIRVLTLAEVKDHALAVRGLVDLQVPRGELKNILLRCRNWKGDDLRLEAPGAIQRREAPPGPAGRTWNLEWQTPLTGHAQLTLAGRIPWEAGEEVRLPEIEVEGAGRLERWVAIAGPGLQADSPRGLQAVPEPAQALAAWPAEAEEVQRTGQAWKVTAADWQLRLSPHYPSGGTMPVRIFLAEQAATLVDGRHWVHQATYWLYQETGTNLSVLLPAGASVLSLDIDGMDVTPLQPQAEHLWLPLPGPGGACTVHLRWMFSPERETFPQPNLAPPQLEKVTDGPTVWVLAIPPGFQINARDPKGRRTANPLAAGEVPCGHAEVQLQLSGLLAPRLQANGGGVFQAQLLAVQEEFYRSCRRAERELTSLGLPTTRVEDLRNQDRKLAEAQGFESLRVRAEKAAAAGPSAPP